MYAGGTEFSLEELRAQRFFKLHKHLLITQKEFDSAATEKALLNPKEIEKLTVEPSEEVKPLTELSKEMKSVTEPSKEVNPHIEEEARHPGIDDFKPNQKIMFSEVT